MALEVGSILTGRISGITKFGVFVDLPDGSTGMVHISEVSQSFVNEIREFVKEGQDIKVKVLSLGENGRISLSIKQAEDKKKPQSPRVKKNKSSSSVTSSPGNFEWQVNWKNSEHSSFEDMMSKFKQSSEDKMSDLKRGNESKGYSRRGGRR